ncbi:U1 small nuclear ribonucleoprotein C [Cicer arietinum]|uniref:U1 small nuclear ribonucleoprotein C n=1 Tax=Cicer arietinum TaxID=3827 RepID=A0A1S2XTN7_CICAR|nr:U1 small nuclear ribonucleoprotein C [Cicer arietinum]XP_004494317.1 U1 small nuclear ribonucleoprotein C [Cicer arietinum]
MPRYYCDYCDTYLTHDSPSVRKQHNAGYKHKANVRSYYLQFEEQQTQSLIDQRIKEHLGQAAAFQQVGVAFNPMMGQRPSLPILPSPRLPIPGNASVLGGQPLFPGMRPLLPRPGPVQGYYSAPGIPPNIPPPGVPSVPGQANTLPRPPTLAPPPMVPENSAAPSSNGAPPMVSSAMYPANSSAPSTGGYESYNPNTQPSTGGYESYNASTQQPEGNR